MTTSNPIALDYSSSDTKRFWWQHLTRYHWLVLLVASLAWFFDCLDQRIFSLARNPALAALKTIGTTDKNVQDFGKVVTAFFLIGWGVGGLTFGALGDKFGRTKMLSLTILIYSLFTGLSFFSVGWWDFALFRFLTGVGVGGVFGLAVALIAETVPAPARTQSLGLLQILSAFGNISSSLVMMGAAWLEAQHLVAKGQSWRYMFLVGSVPALMVVVIIFFIREPEPWLRLKEQGWLRKGGIFSPYRNLLGNARWRRNLIVGALIASTGVVGLWAIGEYAVDLQTNLFNTYYHVPPGQSSPEVSHARAMAFLYNQIGAAFGMWLFTRIALTAGRRIAFLLGFSSALVVTAYVYWKMTTPFDAYWMMPLMGITQLSVFAGFSIYLPELFPSSMRSTGTSFCYNLGRFGAAGGSFFSAILSTQVFGGLKSPLPLRYSAMAMCAIFLVGIAVLPFAPETRGKPLPEDDASPAPGGFPVIPVAVK